MGHFKLSNRWILTTIGIILTGSTLLFFQNCGKGFKAIEATTQQASSVYEVPQIFLTTPLADLTKNRTLVINFSVSIDPRLGMSAATCQLNSNPPVDCTGLTTTFSGLADGAYALKINATDTLKQSAAEFVKSFQVDGTPPEIVVSKSPSPVSALVTDSFTFTVSDNYSGSIDIKVECSLDGAAFATCKSPAEVKSLAAGNHQFQIRATDKAGNVSANFTHSWKIDLTAPVLNIVTKPGAIEKVKNANFTFNGTDDGNAITEFECRIDSGSWGACTSPKDYSDLADGIHVFELRGKDGNGIWSSPVSYSWRIDTVAPTINIVSKPTDPTTSTSASFTFNITEGGSGIQSVECKLDAGAFAACTSNSTQSYAGPLAVGAHSFTVRATDKAGNSQEASYAWNISEPVPPPPPPPVNWTVPTITFVEGSGSTYDLKTTLPKDGSGNLLVKAGGSFAVDGSGAGLPSGMTLSTAGVLSVGTAVVGDTNNVIFSYTEP
ncbi:MAG: hypothetical protein IT288_15065 [Bdellovibrionales bacterium]|nr:hypothetical protein [Bdellovibrionales bacterium]